MECTVKIALRVYYSPRGEPRCLPAKLAVFQKGAVSSFCCHSHCQLCNERLRDAHTHPLHWNSELQQFICAIVPSLYNTYMTASECDVYVQLSPTSSVELR